MKSVLLVFLLNTILIATAQYSNYNIFSLQRPGCESATLELNKCGFYCNNYVSISGDFNNFELTYYTDSYCKKIDYIDQNTPNVIAFNCYEEYNELADGLIRCSNLKSKYNSFQISNYPCEDDKLIGLRECTSICNSHITIKYDPFQLYSITKYTNKDCSDKGITAPFDCNSANGLLVNCYTETSSSSSIHINYTFIIISIVLILFIYNN